MSPISAVRWKAICAIRGSIIRRTTKNSLCARFLNQSKNACTANNKPIKNALKNLPGEKIVFGRQGPEVQILSPRPVGQGTVRAYCIGLHANLPSSISHLFCIFSNTLSHTLLEGLRDIFTFPNKFQGKTGRSES